MTIRTTHTLVDLPITPRAFNEIATALRAAGYSHAFLDGGRVDMTGIAVTGSGEESCARCSCVVRPDPRERPVLCTDCAPHYDESACDHVNEREIAGGFLECDECGRQVPA